MKSNIFFQSDKENSTTMEMVTEITNNEVDFALELENDLTIVIENTEKEPETTTEFANFVVDYEVELDNSTLTDDETLLQLEWV